MLKNPQMYGWLGSSYYAIPDNGESIVIPENAEYTASAIQSKIYSDVRQCTMDIYQYASDLITDCNSKRVAFMKEYLLETGVKSIYNLNKDYIIKVSYDIYNKDGTVISSGTVSKTARVSTAMIHSGISEGNIMDYRNGLIFDTGIEIQIPKISRYGIKNACVQYPYTIKINSISVSTTIGDSRYVIESDTQSVSHDTYHHADHCNYHCHRPNHLHFNNFASHFLTNARVGTTIIDQMVVPAQLEIPPEYTEVQLCHIDLDDSYSVVKINDAVELINMNIEVLFDNVVSVYSKADIDAIIMVNNLPEEVPEEVPDEVPEDDTPEEPPINEDVNDDSDGNTGDVNDDATDDETVEDNVPEVPPVNEENESPDGDNGSDTTEVQG